MEPVTLSTAPPEHPILDYDGLVAEGRRLLERLTDGCWTDFNSHDPGITILEALCYALTDLGYRAFHEVQDLLADGGADATKGLFSAAEALCGRAVTLADLRRVALDVEGVKNAWIEPVERPAIPLVYDEGTKELSVATVAQSVPGAQGEPVVLNGLYRVLIEKSDLEDVDGAALRRAVARRLHAHRNLCEDFDEIRVLETQPIAVFGGIEIGELEAAEEVLTAIFERIANYVSPTIPFLTLEQAMARGLAVSDIFEGPALERGFVDDATLAAAQRRRALHVSDIVREIMAVKGVRAVRQLRLAKAGGGRGEPWSLALDDPNATPKFSPADSRIELFKGPLALQLDDAARRRAHRAFAERLRATRLFRPLSPPQRDLMPPPGRDRGVATYFPLEYDFPLAYGIGRGPLPASSAPARRACANQLRAYLALFDQLLANAFAQLAHAHRLLSSADATSLSYATQPVPAPAEGPQAPVFAEGFDANALQALVEAGGSPDALRRCNRFLNHLLARFGEAITDDPLPMPGADGDDAAALARLVAGKRAFLAQLPRLSGGRGSGVNYLEPATRQSAAPLADRLRLKLNLPEAPWARVLVIEHILLRAIGDDALQGMPFLAAAASRDPFSLQLSVVFAEHLRPLAPLIERLVREETPAHLTAYVHWLNEADLDSLAASYEAWLAALRRYTLADGFGIDVDQVP